MPTNPLPEPAQDSLLTNPKERNRTRIESGRYPTRSSAPPKARTSPPQFPCARWLAGWLDGRFSTHTHRLDTQTQTHRHHHGRDTRTMQAVRRLPFPTWTSAGNGFEEKSGVGLFAVLHQQRLWLFEFGLSFLSVIRFGSSKSPKVGSSFFVFIEDAPKATAARRRTKRRMTKSSSSSQNGVIPPHPPPPCCCWLLLLGWVARRLPLSSIHPSIVRLVSSSIKVALAQSTQKKVRSHFGLGEREAPQTIDQSISGLIRKPAQPNPPAWSVKVPHNRLLRGVFLVRTFFFFFALRSSPSTRTLR